MSGCSYCFADEAEFVDDDGEGLCRNCAVPETGDLRAGQ